MIGVAAANGMLYNSRCKVGMDVLRCARAVSGVNGISSSWPAIIDGSVAKGVVRSLARLTNISA